MKDIKVILSSLAIIISFFAWYYFSQIKKDIEKQEKQNYVNIEVLKTKIKISKDKNTKVKINWKQMQDEIYNLN